MGEIYLHAFEAQHRDAVAAAARIINVRRPTTGPLRTWASELLHRARSVWLGTIDLDGATAFSGIFTPQPHAVFLAGISSKIFTIDEHFFAELTHAYDGVRDGDRASFGPFCIDHGGQLGVLVDWGR